MNLRDPGDDRDDIEDSDVAQTVYDMDCEEILRDLAFLDTDIEILKWARSVKQAMYDLASEAKADAKEE
jgi:hypothetical protein